MQQGQNRKPDLIGRLNEVTRDLNAVLLVLAIGLAVLDMTCFLMLEVRDALPPARVAADPWSVATPATPAGQALAAPVTKSDAAVTGAQARRGRDL